MSTSSEGSIGPRQREHLSVNEGGRKTLCRFDLNGLNTSAHREKSKGGGGRVRKATEESGRGREVTNERELLRVAGVGTILVAVEDDFEIDFESLVEFVLVRVIYLTLLQRHLRVQEVRVQPEPEHRGLGEEKRGERREKREEAKKRSGEGEDAGRRTEKAGSKEGKTKSREGGYRG